MKNKLMKSMGLISAIALPAIAVVSCGDAEKSNTDDQQMDSWTKANTAYHNKVLTIKSSATEVKLGYYADKKIDKIIFEDPSKITKITKEFFDGINLSSGLTTLLNNENITKEEYQEEVNKLFKMRDDHSAIFDKNAGYFNFSLFPNVTEIGEEAFENFNFKYLFLDDLPKLKKIGAGAFKDSYLKEIDFGNSKKNIDLIIGNNAFKKTIYKARLYFDNSWRYNPIDNSVDSNSVDRLFNYVKDNQDKIFGKDKDIILNKESDLWFEGKESSGPVIYLPQTQNDQKNWKKFVYFPQHLERINDYAFSNSIAVGTLDLSHTNTLYIGNNAFRDSKFDLIVLSGLMTKAKAKGKTLQINKLVFESSLSTTKVKISQSDWDELIKNSKKRELEWKLDIFGPNGKDVTRKD